MEVLACLNGETMPVEQASVPVWDRGFLFGDSVYEVCRIYRGRCWLEAEHFARLRRSLKELEFPPVDIDRLIERVHRTIAASGIEEGTVYIQITRGVAPRSHAFPDPPVAADRAHRRPPLRRRRRPPGSARPGSRSSAIPTSAGSAATSRRPTSWPTASRPRPPAAPGASRRSWLTPTASSPRPRTPRCSGSAGPARGHARRPRDPPRYDPATGPPAARRARISRSSHSRDPRGTEGGRRGDPGRDHDARSCPIVQIDDDPIGDRTARPRGATPVGRLPPGRRTLAGRPASDRLIGPVPSLLEHE